MHVTHLSLTDFRSYRSAELSFAPGLTAVVGANGEGKTNLLEAIGWLATLSSFRGAPPDALIFSSPLPLPVSGWQGAGGYVAVPHGRAGCGARGGLRERAAV